MAEVTNPAADVKVGDLPAYLAGVSSADEVTRLKGLDDRVTAQEHYDARLAELTKAPPSPADRAAAAAPTAPQAKPVTGERRARTHVKYAGTWYRPGEPVPFKSAADAEPYDAARALELERKK